MSCSFLCIFCTTPPGHVRQKRVEELFKSLRQHTRTNDSLPAECVDKVELVSKGKKQLARDDDSVSAVKRKRKADAIALPSNLPTAGKSGKKSKSHIKPESPCATISGDEAKQMVAVELAEFILSRKRREIDANIGIKDFKESNSKCASIMFTHRIKVKRLSEEFPEMLRWLPGGQVGLSDDYIALNGEISEIQKSGKRGDATCKDASVKKFSVCENAYHSSPLPAATVSLPPPLPALPVKGVELSAANAKELVVQYMAAFVAKTPKWEIDGNHGIKAFKRSNQQLGELMLQHSMKPKKMCDEYPAYLRWMPGGRIGLSASYAALLGNIKEGGSGAENLPSKEKLADDSDLAGKEEEITEGHQSESDNGSDSDSESDSEDGSETEGQSGNESGGGDNSEGDGNDENEDDDNDVETNSKNMTTSVETAVVENQEKLKPLLCPPPLPTLPAKGVELSAADAKELVVQHVAAFVAKTPKKEINGNHGITAFKRNNQQLGELMFKHSMKPKKMCDEYPGYLCWMPGGRIGLSASYTALLGNMEEGGSGAENLPLKEKMDGKEEEITNGYQSESDSNSDSNSESDSEDGSDTEGQSGNEKGGGDNSEGDGMDENEDDIIVEGCDRKDDVETSADSEYITSSVEIAVVENQEKLKPLLCPPPLPTLPAKGVELSAADAKELVVQHVAAFVAKTPKKEINGNHGITAFKRNNQQLGELMFKHSMKPKKMCDEYPGYLCWMPGGRIGLSASYTALLGNIEEGGSGAENLPLKEKMDGREEEITNGYQSESDSNSDSENDSEDGSETEGQSGNEKGGGDNSEGDGMDENEDDIIVEGCDRKDDVETSADSENITTSVEIAVVENQEKLKPLLCPPPLPTLPAKGVKLSAADAKELVVQHVAAFVAKTPKKEINGNHGITAFKRNNQQLGELMLQHSMKPKKMCDEYPGYLCWMPGGRIGLSASYTALLGNIEEGGSGAENLPLKEILADDSDLAGKEEEITEGHQSESDNGSDSDSESDSEDGSETEGQSGNESGGGDNSEGDGNDENEDDYKDENDNDDNDDIETNSENMTTSVETAVVENQEKLKPLLCPPTLPTLPAKGVELSAADAKELVVQHVAAFVAKTPKKEINGNHGITAFKRNNQQLGELMFKHSMKPKKMCDEYPGYLCWMPGGRIGLSASYTALLGNMEEGGSGAENLPLKEKMDGKEEEITKGRQSESDNDSDRDSESDSEHGSETEGQSGNESGGDDDDCESMKVGSFNEVVDREVLRTTEVTEVTGSDNVVMSAADSVHESDCDLNKNHKIIDTGTGVSTSSSDSDSDSESDSDTASDSSQPSATVNVANSFPLVDRSNISLAREVYIDSSDTDNDDNDVDETVDDKNKRRVSFLVSSEESSKRLKQAEASPLASLLFKPLPLKSPSHAIKYPAVVTMNSEVITSSCEKSTSGSLTKPNGGTVASRLEHSLNDIDVIEPAIKKIEKEDEKGYDVSTAGVDIAKDDPLPPGKRSCPRCGRVLSIKTKHPLSACDAYLKKNSMV